MPSTNTALRTGFTDNVPADTKFHEPVIANATMPHGDVHKICLNLLHLNNCAMGYIERSVTDGSTKLGVELLFGDKLNDFENSDITAILSESVQAVQNVLSILEIVASKYGMVFQRNKCKSAVED